ncbi:hypothetical protein BLS_001206 [Venturia inaequalis]|uniref:Uncharacterized protein n=1 Tax=Venturia inaequalis TaxID=5025 RepID=A0A8H3Z1V1_VENIN|nr:hypothetical protein BLS_001206 [Venturia inaequalis]
MAVHLHQANFHSRHYSYECKAKPEERPYRARPSRTAQLKNPKLAPKLNSDVPNDLLRKKGTADEILASKATERGPSAKHLENAQDDPSAPRQTLHLRPITATAIHGGGASQNHPLHEEEDEADPAVEMHDLDHVVVCTTLRGGVLKVDRSPQGMSHADRMKLEKGMEMATRAGI